MVSPKVLIFLIFGVLSVKLSAQSSSDSEHQLKVLKDAPDDINFVRITFPLWNGSFSGFNASAFDAVVNGHFQIGNKFYFMTSIRRGLFEKLSPYIGAGEANNPYEEYAVSVYKKTQSNSIHAEGTFFFSEKINQKPIHYPIGTTGYVLLRHGVRLGLTRGITWYAFNNQSTVGVDLTGNVQQLDMKSKSTYINYTNLRFGLCRSKQKNIHVDSPYWGYRTRSVFKYLYTDLIVSIQSNYDDVYAAYEVNDQEGQDRRMYYRRYEIDSNAKKARFGFAFGLRAIPLSGPLGFDMEVGRFTGLENEDNQYIQMGFNLVVGTTEKLRGIGKKS